MSRILIADESPLIISLVRRTIARCGQFDVVVAGNAAQALDAFRRVRPDITLLGMPMQDGDGAALLQAIRAVDAQADVIVLAGEDNASVAARSLARGARACVSKAAVQRDLPALLHASAQRRAA